MRGCPKVLWCRLISCRKMENSINKKDYQGFNFLSTSRLFADRKLTQDRDGRMKELYNIAFRHSNDYKCFYYTDSAYQRALAMDTSKLTNEDFMLLFADKEECGIILTGGKFRRIHCIYSLTDHQIIVKAFLGNIYASDWVYNPELRSENDFGMRAKMLGGAIINSDGVAYYPDCALSTLIELVKFKSNGMQTSNLKFDDSELGTAKKMVEELSNFKNDKGMIELNPARIESEKDNAPILFRELQTYKEKSNLLEAMVKSFIFIKTANIIEQTYVSQPPTCTYRRKQGKKLDYIRIDNTWDADIDVINPFKVSGHFRHQPKKNEKGEWIRELIYIDEFMKHGYHRRATKKIKG